MSRARKRLGENICLLPSGNNVFELYCVTLDEFPDKMMLYVNMFRSLVCTWVDCQTHCPLIVDVEDCRPTHLEA